MPPWLAPVPSLPDRRGTLQPRWPQSYTALAAHPAHLEASQAPSCHWWCSQTSLKSSTMWSLLTDPDLRHLSHLCSDQLHHKFQHCLKSALSHNCFQSFRFQPCCCPILLRTGLKALSLLWRRCWSSWSCSAADWRTCCSSSSRSCCCPCTASSLSCWRQSWNRSSSTCCWS